MCITDSSDHIFNYQYSKTWIKPSRGWLQSFSQALKAPYCAKLSLLRLSCCGERGADGGRLGIPGENPEW